MEKLKVLDIFSGIGGFSLGLERTGGFETVAFCEIDETARKVLRKHWPKVPIFNDVSKVTCEYEKNIYYNESGTTSDGNDYKRIDYSSLPHIDVICGGFPCQDISVAGKGLGLKGERSGLWKEYARLIEEIKPRYAIIENVANLRSKGLARVLQDLWEIGYDCEWHIIPASSVGALHKRERIWIIAYPNCHRRGESVSISARNERESLQFVGDGTEEQMAKSICNTSSIGRNGCSRKERHIQNNEKWNSEKIHSKREQCELVSRTDGEILSRGHIESIRSAYSDHWELVPRVHRVVNGLSKGMERARRERIKQLGNAVVPQIPELIGNAIIEFEKSHDKSI